jgi:uncharacterized membrane protein
LAYATEGPVRLVTVASNLRSPCAKINVKNREKRWKTKLNLTKTIKKYKNIKLNKKKMFLKNKHTYK